MSYTLSKSAKRELRKIAKYIARDNPVAADKLMVELVDLFKLLGRNRMIGRSREDVRAGYRSFPQGSYNVFYRLAPEGVNIMHVVHGSRDLTAYPFES